MLAKKKKEKKNSASYPTISCFSENPALYFMF